MDQPPEELLFPGPLSRVMGPSYLFRISHRLKIPDSEVRKLFEKYPHLAAEASILLQALREYPELKDEIDTFKADLSYSLSLLFVAAVLALLLLDSTGGTIRNVSHFSQEQTDYLLRSFLISTLASFGFLCDRIFIYRLYESIREDMLKKQYWKYIRNLPIDENSES